MNNNNNNTTRTTTTIVHPDKVPRTTTTLTTCTENTNTNTNTSIHHRNRVEEQQSPPLPIQPLPGYQAGDITSITLSLSRRHGVLPWKHKHQQQERSIYPPNHNNNNNNNKHPPYDDDSLSIYNNNNNNKNHNKKEEDEEVHAQTTTRRKDTKRRLTTITENDNDRSSSNNKKKNHHELVNNNTIVKTITETTTMKTSTARNSTSPSNVTTKKRLSSSSQQLLLSSPLPSKHKLFVGLSFFDDNDNVNKSKQIEMNSQRLYTELEQLEKEFFTSSRTRTTTTRRLPTTTKTKPSSFSSTKRRNEQHQHQQQHQQQYSENHQSDDLNGTVNVTESEMVVFPVVPTTTVEYGCTKNSVSVKNSSSAVEEGTTTTTPPTTTPKTTMNNNKNHYETKNQTQKQRMEIVVVPVHALETTTKTTNCHHHRDHHHINHNNSIHNNIKTNNNNYDNHNNIVNHHQISKHTNHHDSSTIFCLKSHGGSASSTSSSSTNSSEGISPPLSQLLIPHTSTSSRLLSQHHQQQQHQVESTTATRKRQRNSTDIPIEIVCCHVEKKDDDDFDHPPSNNTNNTVVLGESQIVHPNNNKNKDINNNTDADNIDNVQSSLRVHHHKLNFHSNIQSDPTNHEEQQQPTHGGGEYTDDDDKNHTRLKETIFNCLQHIDPNRTSLREILQIVQKKYQIKTKITKQMKCMIKDIIITYLQQQQQQQQLLQKVPKTASTTTTNNITAINGTTNNNEVEQEDKLLYSQQQHHSSSVPEGPVRFYHCSSSTSIIDNNDDQIKIISDNYKENDKPVNDTKIHAVSRTNKQNIKLQGNMPAAETNVPFGIMEEKMTSLDDQMLLDMTRECFDSMDPTVATMKDIVTAVRQKIKMTTNNNNKNQHNNKIMITTKQQKQRMKEYVLQLLMLSNQQQQNKEVNQTTNNNNNHTNNSQILPPSNLSTDPLCEKTNIDTAWIELPEVTAITVSNNTSDLSNQNGTDSFNKESSCSSLSVLRTNISTKNDIVPCNSNGSVIYLQENGTILYDTEKRIVTSTLLSHQPSVTIPESSLEQSVVIDHANFDTHEVQAVSRLDCNAASATSKYFVDNVHESAVGVPHDFQELQGPIINTTNNTSTNQQIKKGKRGRPAGTIKERGGKRSVQSSTTDPLLNTSDENSKHIHPTGVSNCVFEAPIPSKKKRVYKPRCSLCAKCPCKNKVRDSIGSSSSAFDIMSKSAHDIEKAYIKRMQKLEIAADQYDEQREAVRRRLLKHRREMWMKWEQASSRGGRHKDDAFQKRTCGSAWYIPDSKQIDEQAANDRHRKQGLNPQIVSKAQAALFSFAPTFQPTLTQILCNEKNNKVDENVVTNGLCTSIVDPSMQNAKHDANLPPPIHKYRDDDTMDSGPDVYLEESSVRSELKPKRLEAFPDKDVTMSGFQSEQIWASVQCKSFESAWDRLFLDPECDANGVDHLIDLLSDTDSQLSEDQTDNDEESSSHSQVSLSQRASTISKEIIMKVETEDGQLSKIVAICPQWKENVNFALSRTNSIEMDGALRNIQSSRLNLQKIKEAFLLRMEQQETVLKFYEQTLLLSKERLKKI